jgi:nucleoside 2-deoxyribosyltransferase
MKSVVLCGSRRFKEEIFAFADQLRAAGVVVYAPYLHSGQDEWQTMSPDFQRFCALGLTHDHFYKIHMADVVFVYNKDGYAGNSTTLEIGYAVALGKPMYALANDPELCRHVLFREILTSAAELVQRLK